VYLIARWSCGTSEMKPIFILRYPSEDAGVSSLPAIAVFFLSVSNNTNLNNLIENKI
jgi:hypothetical protein